MSATVSYKGSTIGVVENETKKLDTAGTWLEADVIITDVTSGGANLQSKSVSYTPTTSAQSQTVTADSGYDGLSSVAISVAAMPSGTEGTPTATKGTVSNHSVSVTPSVTNTEGYIAGGTHNGTAVTVSASELDSGTKSITANGTGIDVVGYASVDVAVPSPFVITVYKDNNDEWYPTVTFAEILAAHNAGREIVVEADGDSDSVSADGEMKIEGGGTYFVYWVRRYVPNTSPIEIIEQGYSMYSGGVSIDEEQIYINPVGTLQITSNGTVNVKNYASVNVNVASGGYTLEQVNAVGFPAMTETNVVMGSATTLRPFMFRGNTSITSFSGANITDTKGDGYGSGAESHTFQNCTNLVSASLPKVKDLYHTDYIFSGCTKLQTCEMDWMNMTRLGTGVFQGCSALQKTSFVLPKLASNVYGYFISANPNLTAFDMGSASINMGNYNVAANAFNGDSNLSIFVIRCTNRVYSLANVSAFTNTPFANGKAGGTLYVPNSLIASYQSATNWVTILGYANNKIKSIESTATDPDAPIDLTTHYIDGTLI